jgi:hypothetical protein
MITPSEFQLRCRYARNCTVVDLLLLNPPNTKTFWWGVRTGLRILREPRGPQGSGRVGIPQGFGKRNPSAKWRIVVGGVERSYFLPSRQKEPNCRLFDSRLPLIAPAAPLHAAGS